MKSGLINKTAIADGEIIKILLQVLAPILLVLSGCRFEQIDQPETVQAGETFSIRVLIADAIDETTNPHKGVLCILIPSDWSLVSARYEGGIGSGEMLYSPEWSDSAEYYYSAVHFDPGMSWVSLISDSGYTYTGDPAVTVTVDLTAGESSGCFNLAYLATKATPNLIGSSWSPFSYPNPISVGEDCVTTGSYLVEPADNWSNLFDLTSGWTGSDAAYSIPLSGYDAPGDPNYSGTLFVFGDTFIGDVDSNDIRKNSMLIRNTAALLDSRGAQKDSITFIWNDSIVSQPRPLFNATTPLAGDNDWIWPMDGITVGDSVFIYGLRLKQTTGVVGFDVAGVTLISFSVDSLPRIMSLNQIDMPNLFIYETLAGYNTVMGQAVMPLTAESGNPNPDGYIYVYGVKSTSLGKKLIAGRVRPENISDQYSYEFWDGNSWGAELAVGAELTGGLSQEFSVTPTNDGRYLVIFERGGQISIKFGDNPNGPFDIFPQAVYTCPEPILNSNTYVYNAKAHPHLSQQQRLLISYNVNSMSLSDLMNQADIYRPRFITLFFDSTVVSVEEPKIALPELISLVMNYPNPFNTSTSIRYTIGAAGAVKVMIYDLKGRLVKQLTGEHFSAGHHSLQWDGRDNQLLPASSGVYLYQVIYMTDKTLDGSNRANGKMILLK